MKPIQETIDSKVEPLMVLGPQIEPNDEILKDRNLVQRWFSPIGDGSFRGSVFALASVTFGTGCLAFPDAFHASGPAIGILVLIVVACYSYFTLHVLIESAFHYNLNEYNDIVLASIGKKWVYVAEICNLFLCVAVIMSYEYNIAKFTVNILRELSIVKEDSDEDPNLKFVKMISMAVFCVPQILLSVLRDMSSLQIVCIAGTASLIYTICVVVFQMPFFLLNRIEMNKETNFWSFRPLGILDCISTFLFGFCAHNGIFPVYKDLRRANFKRCVKVLNRAFYLELVLYSSISFLGFFSTFSDTKDLFILRDNLNEGVDYFMVIGKITLIICLHCVLAVNFNLMRITIKYSFFNNQELSNLQNVSVTVGVLVLTNIVTFFVHDIKQIFNLIGGVGTIGICFVVPTLVYVKKSGKPKTEIKNLLALIAMIITTLVGISCTAKGIADFVKPGWDK